MFTVAIGTGLVSVSGATPAALASDVWLDVLGIAIAAVGATVGVVSAWDAHFQHRELWIQKTQTLKNSLKHG